MAWETAISILDGDIDAAIGAPQLEGLPHHQRANATVECWAHHLEEEALRDVGALLVDGNELLVRVDRDQFGRCGWRMYLRAWARSAVTEYQPEAHAAAKLDGDCKERHRQGGDEALSPMALAMLADWGSASLTASLLSTAFRMRAPLNNGRLTFTRC